MEIYLVGGAVRDELLGRKPSERDWVVVGATPERLIAQGYRPVGKDFPVFLHPASGEEYALARTERKTAPGYRGFQIHAAPDVTLEDDLRRRDLTINAMARAADGTLVDPYGGQSDIEARMLRHVSPAFAEDPVRVLRVARFAARFAIDGFSVAAETLALMRRMAEGGEVDALVPERVWQEMRTALGETRPQMFIEVLHECGALARILPEVERLFGIPQPIKWHPEIDTGKHTLMVLEQAAALSAETRIRFAALTHDLGKGTSPPERLPAHHGHEARGAAMIDQLAERLRIPNDYRDLALLVARHHCVAHRALELRPATALKLMERLDAFRRPQRFEEFLLTCEADMRGRKGFETRPYPQAGRLRALRAAAADIAFTAAPGEPGAETGRRLRNLRLRAIERVQVGPDQPSA